MASHLHQSDLLVLDYELDKTSPGDCTRAVEILRALITNDHFNLVVVHTNEDLDTAYTEIILRLLTPMEDHLSNEQRGVADTLIADLEDIDEDIQNALREAVTVTQYLHARLHSDKYLRIMGKKCEPYSAFSALAKEAKWNNNDRGLVLQRLLAKVETSLKGKLSDQSAEGLKWSTSEIKWIKAEIHFRRILEEIRSRRSLQGIAEGAGGVEPGAFASAHGEAPRRNGRVRSSGANASARTEACLGALVRAAPSFEGRRAPLANRRERRASFRHSCSVPY